MTHPKFKEYTNPTSIWVTKQGDTFDSTEWDVADGDLGGAGSIIPAYIFSRKEGHLMQGAPVYTVTVPVSEIAYVQYFEPGEVPPDDSEEEVPL